MAGNILANVIAAGLDAFSFTLLIPFLNALFNAPSLLPKAAGSVHWLADLQATLLQLEDLLHQQCEAKRLKPNSGDVPGQPDC